MVVVTHTHTYTYTHTVTHTACGRVLLFTAHAMGCCFVMLANGEDKRDYPITWITAYDPTFDPHSHEDDISTYIIGMTPPSTPTVMRTTSAHTSSVSAPR